MKKTVSIIAICCLLGGFAKAQTDVSNPSAHFFNTGMDYGVRAHFSIGGSSPLGLPREIRKIEDFNPGLQIGLEANATKWLHEQRKWAFRMGIRFETKGMETKAKVKNYLTEVAANGAKVRGYYTGVVETNVQNTYFTAPINAVYRFSDRWNIYGGLYFSTLLNNTFDGSVSEGYLRQDTPTGTKISFEDGSEAFYDFSDNIRKFQWGSQIGAEWNMNRHFKLLTDLSYGFNNILKEDFKSIDFSMHNIYLDIGFGYTF